METKIYSNHIPALKNGEYEVSINQSLSVMGHNLNAKLSRPFVFKVEGEEYNIGQQQVDSVFPPEGSMGDFSLVFPQIILKRSTFPWERFAKEGEENQPWLALIICSESEIGDPHSNNKIHPVHIKKSDWEAAVQGNNSNITFEEASLSTGSPKEDLVSIIAAKSNILLDKLPSFESLQYLAHVRKIEDNGTGDGRTIEEKAVVVCHGLPVIGQKNFIHLVSLHDRFDDQNQFKPVLDSNYTDALVSLKSWSFFCNDHFIISEELVENYKSQTGQTINTAPTGNLVENNLRNVISNLTGKEYFDKQEIIDQLPVEYADLPISPSTNDEKIYKQQLDFLLKTFRVGHLPDILKHLNFRPGTLRVPDSFYRNRTDKEYSILGFLKMDYILRTGKEIDCYYRSPLLPVDPAPLDNTNVALRHSESAFQYLEEAKKLNVSYSAAWELGRLLMLQNKNVSTALYKWKRTCHQLLKQEKRTIDQSNYPKPENIIVKWFEDIKNFKGIPFNYLVPEKSFIPFESLRFFNIDLNWLKYFIDGAFSMGRISNFDKKYDLDIYKYQSSKSNSTNGFENFLVMPQKNRSGFLLHSVAVSGWPDMIIYGNGNESLIPNRIKLSPNLLLGLFDEKITSISLHQKPEGVHFGLEDDEEAHAFHQQNQSLPRFKGYPKLASPHTIHENIADFVNTLVQQIEVVSFTLK